jgi:hypothetical protein
MLLVQLVPHGPSPRSWEAARRARKPLPVWRLAACLPGLQATQTARSGLQPGPQTETAPDGPPHPAAPAELLRHDGADCASLSQ